MVASDPSNDGLIQKLTVLATQIDLLDMDLIDAGAINGLSKGFFSLREMALARMKNNGSSLLSNDELLEELMEIAIKIAQGGPEILAEKYKSFKREILRRMGQPDLVAIQTLHR